MSLLFGYNSLFRSLKAAPSTLQKGRRLTAAAPQAYPLPVAAGFSLRFMGRRGSVLVLSVWILTYLVILSAAVYGAVYSKLKLVRAIEERSIGRYLAKSACIHAKYLRQMDKTGSDTLYELTAKTEKELDSGKFSYYLTDEESKININNASVEVLSRLPGLDADLAQKIAAARNIRLFGLKEELLLVEGITGVVFDKCRGFITTYSNNMVNINTASSEVLTALGVEDSLIAVIKNFRAGTDGLEATEDDNAFENQGAIIDTLRLAGMTPEQEALFTVIMNTGVFTASAVNFTLEIETEVIWKQAVKYTVVMAENCRQIKQWVE